MPSSAPGVKAALVTVLAALFPRPVNVSYGDPGSDQPDQIVAVMGQRAQIERPVMTPSRPREEIVETDVVFSVFVGGGNEMQQTTTEAAWALLGTFEDYFKTKPNETLSGACREAWVSSYALTEATSVDPPSGWVTGQVSEITAVVTSKTRI